MRTSDTINELATALAKAQAEISNAKFDNTNPHFKSRYATLAAVRDTVTPALTANGIALVQMTGPWLWTEKTGERTYTGQMMLYTRLVHSSGQWIECQYPVVLDLAKPQLTGSALTYARRYSISAICNIASEEDDDAEAATKQNGNGFPSGNPEVKYYKTDAKTPGAVKARDNSSYYTSLEREIRDCKTKEACRDWRKMRERDLAEQVGPEAMLHLSEFYENHMASLP